MRKHQVCFRSLFRLVVLCLLGCFMAAAVSSCGHRTCVVVTDSGRRAFFELGDLKRAARAGDADAQMLLGYVYARGEYVTKDDQSAVEWWRKAAAQGNREAREALRERGEH